MTPKKTYKITQEYLAESHCWDNSDYEEDINILIDNLPENWALNTFESMINLFDPSSNGHYARSWDNETILVYFYDLNGLYGDCMILKLIENK